MGDNLKSGIKEICQKHENDKTRMMDIVLEVQKEFGCVSAEAMDLIANAVSSYKVEVESVVSFYSFLSEEKKGKVVIRLCNDIVDKMHGVDLVAQAFTEEFGIEFGESTPDGKFSLEYTPCIGMCDQAPAALINDKVLTWLSSDSARQIAKSLKENDGTSKLNSRLGDGNNAHELVQSMVTNNIRKKGGVIFDNFEPGTGIKNALALSSVEVINTIKASRVRGRGGAGFPTGMKWEFTRSAQGTEKYIICNADEGEPGTFKDRAILTEAPHLLFEGMTVAGYAIGAQLGIIYLRAEYAYLRSFLEALLVKSREQNLLGNNICGKEGFNFDIRIQMGAGAYICGEETALISSCEGLRGDPKNRPPFPAQEGYLKKPTCVNNVETLCCVARVMEKGSAWFAEQGSAGSSGAKLLSVSGDCKSPGVYEVHFGLKLRELLNMVGAEDSIGVQVGGPSGQMVSPDCYDRAVCYDDLATGGSIMVFGPGRDILDVAQNFMDFFEEESCGYCTPCRTGNKLMNNCLKKIMAGKGQPEDIDYLEQIGETIKTTSRCGLGQTSPNPILSTIKNFRPLYDKLVNKSKDGLNAAFDLEASVSQAEQIAGRKSVHHQE